MPDKVIHWECHYCYESFDTEEEALYHEKSCAFNESNTTPKSYYDQLIDEAKEMKEQPPDIK